MRMDLEQIRAYVAARLARKQNTATRLFKKLAPRDAVIAIRVVQAAQEALGREVEAAEREAVHSNPGGR